MSLMLVLLLLSSIPPSRSWSCGCEDVADAGTEEEEDEEEEEGEEAQSDKVRIS
jgi:hypothetical protein